MLSKRQEDMLKILRKEKRASVERLAKLCFVSEMTVRRDLNELKANGYIERYHGGAVYLGSDAYPPISSRDVLHRDEKQLLAKSIQKYLKDFMTVYIDSSSTCSYVIPLLAEYKGITVVTNSVYALLKAAQLHLPCIVTGGEYEDYDMCLVGHHAEELVSHINIDIGFFSSKGISADGVISDDNERQTAIRKAVLKNTAVKIFLFSSEKMNQKYLYTVCKRNQADQVAVIKKTIRRERRVGVPQN